MKELIKATEMFFQELYERIPEIVSVIPNNEGWELTVEIVTDDEYTKKRAKNDLISVFKVQANRDFKISSYSRVEIRERGKAVYNMET